MIDKYGEGIVPDLLSHYGIDLYQSYQEWERGGGPSPAFLVCCIWALPEDSMTKALMRGGREHFGWSREAFVLSDIYNALNLNTAVSGNWKDKPPKFPDYPAPKVKGPERKKKKRKSLKDIYSAWMNG